MTDTSKFYVPLHYLIDRMCNRIDTGLLDSTKASLQSHSDSDFLINCAENAWKAVMAGLLLKTFRWMWTSGLITNMLGTFFPTWTFVTGLLFCSFTSIKREKSQQNMQVWMGLKNRQTELAFLTKSKICHFWGTVCPRKRVLDN